MKPIGGFFELKLGGGGRQWHENALALASGRACLRRILDVVRPTRAWVPFYICDAALAPFERASVETVFYGIDEQFEPQIPAGGRLPGECLLYVNYFGLKTATARRLVAETIGPTIVDDTQAFFAQGYEGGWSFDSARKYFGVPDGAYAFGAHLAGPSFPPPGEVHYDHLVNRLLGNQEAAYAQFRESEAHVTAELCSPSRLSERLLARVDYHAVREIRRCNFAALHKALSEHNVIACDLTLAPDSVPFAYPLLIEQMVPWDRLWERGLYAPRLWPELENRRVTRFAWESSLADHLLPLPIDHRYAASDLERMQDILSDALGW